jgi:glycosyltransferase involved in cell wall biosynthesis
MHVFGRMARGGAELRTVEVMRRIGAQVQQEFVALSGLPGDLDEEIVALGGAVHPCRLDLGFAARFARLVRGRRPDVIHSHVHLTSGVILALALVLGVRQRVAHFRSTGDGQKDTRGRRTYRAGARALLDRSATDILGVAECSLAESWSPRWADDPRCRVIYNGVDPARFVGSRDPSPIRAELGLDPRAPLIVQVGRFDPPKNHAFAAEVLAAVPHAHLVFVGRSGSTEVETRRRLQASGASARAHFVGERVDVARWLTGADVSILPSVFEGLPGVVLESLAAGTPVVAHGLPGVREIATRVPGVTTLPNVTDPRAWAAALQPHLAAPIDAAGRDALRLALAASPFTLEAAAAAHLAVWTRGPRRGRG